LCGCTLSSLGGLYGMGMFRCQWEMPEHESKIPTELTLQDLNRLDRFSTIRTFEVAVFDQSDWSGSFPLNVILFRDDQWRLMSA
jgi:hypothetical protein